MKPLLPQLAPDGECKGQINDITVDRIKVPEGCSVITGRPHQEKSGVNEGHVGNFEFPGSSATFQHVWGDLSCGIYDCLEKWIGAGILQIFAQRDIGIIDDVSIRVRLKFMFDNKVNLRIKFQMMRTSLYFIQTTPSETLLEKL